MFYFIRKLQATVAFIISLITISSIAYADDVITFAEADTITGESLINLIAFVKDINQIMISTKIAKKYH